MNLVFLRYPNWYRGLLEGQVGNMPVRVRVSPGGLLSYSATQLLSYIDKAENKYRSGPNRTIQAGTNSPQCLPIFVDFLDFYGLDFSWKYLY